MIERWWFPIVLAWLICFVIGALATVSSVLRRRFGDYYADVAGGAIIILLVSYLVIGACVAITMTLTGVVRSASIEYDSQEFLR